jgi:hypothetical protein
VADVVTRSARRLSMVVERLTKRIPFAGGAAPQAEAQPPAPPPAQLVTMAAASSSSEEELQAYVRTIGAYMGTTEPEKLLKILAADVPQWDIAIPQTEKPPAAIEAMHKIITLTTNNLESSKRYRDLMNEAVEQFNNGALGPAVAMLELANRVVVEKKLDPLAAVERIRSAAVESISSERLRRYTENKTKHPLLRQALSSFPSLTKASLFEQLRGEQRPERRRSLLALLEAYGQQARVAALAELENELKRPSAEIDTYYLRNVIYLLHRIARDSDEGMDKELELLTRATARGQNIYVIKEAVIPLGHLKSEAAVKVLTTRLAELEAMLVRKDISLYPMEEMQKVLDRVTSALGRIATPAALLTVARHGMKPNPLLGDTRARLAVLFAARPFLRRADRGHPAEGRSRRPAGESPRSRSAFATAAAAPTHRSPVQHAGGARGSAVRGDRGEVSGARRGTRGRRGVVQPHQRGTDRRTTNECRHAHGRSGLLRIAVRPAVARGTAGDRHRHTDQPPHGTDGGETVVRRRQVRGRAGRTPARDRRRVSTARTAGGRNIRVRAQSRGDGEGRADRRDVAALRRHPPPRRASATGALRIR